MGEKAKGFAWFDFDGTLCAPVFQDGGKTKIGFLREDLGEFCERMREDAYDNCVPMVLVIEYAKELRKAGYRLGVLSCAYVNGEQIAKRTWLTKQGLGDLFEEVVFLRNPPEKIPFMLERAAQEGFSPDQIVIVEDSYETLISALSAGIVGVHISHILTGVSVPHRTASVCGKIVGELVGKPESTKAVSQGWQDDICCERTAKLEEKSV